MRRGDPKALDKKSARKIFFTGGTSACRTHARTHYDIYKARCKEAGVEEHHWAVPRKLEKERRRKAEEEGQKAAGKDPNAGKLIKMGFVAAPGGLGPKEFSKQSTLEHTAKFIVCTDQVSRQLSSKK